MVSEITKYYARAELKDLILSFAEYERDGVKFSKAAVNDFNGWYNYQKNGKGLMQANDETTYIKLSNKIRRSLYLTLNYYPEDYKPFKESQSQDWQMDGWEKCYSYMLSVDIDLKDPHTVDNPKARKNLEDFAYIVYERLESITSFKLMALSSGNGVYIHLHPEFGTMRMDVSPEDRAENYQAMADGFNQLLKDIQKEIYKSNPEMEKYVKLDPINTINRQIKAPLSIHKDLDYVVYPMKKGSWKIPFKKFQDITKEDIIEVKNYIADFLANKPERDDKTVFNHVVQPLIDKAREIIIEKRERAQYLKTNYKLVEPTEPIPLDIIKEESVIRKLLKPKEWSDGRRRRLNIIVTLLAASGWSYKDTWELIDEFSQKMKWQDIDTYLVMEQHFYNSPPNYKTIYEFESNMFGYGLRSQKEHLPDYVKTEDKYLLVNNQINPAKAIVLNAADNGVAWAQKQLIVWGLKKLDKYGQKSKTIRKIGEYLIKTVKYFIAKDEEELYLYNSEKGIYKLYKDNDFKEFMVKEFDYKFLESEVKSIKGMFYKQGERSERYVAFKNGLLNLEDLKLHDFNSSEFITFQIPYDWNPGASGGFVEEKLREILIDEEGDEAGILNKFNQYLEMVGYCFTPGNPRQKLFLIVGPPGSGKTQINNIIGGIFEGSVASVPLQAFADRFGLQPLIGKKVNIVFDISHHEINDPSALKAVTGMDTMTIDRKYKDPITFEEGIPITTIGAGNELPRITDQPEAMARRIIIMECRNNFTENPVYELSKKILKDKEGMEWLIHESITRYHKMENENSTFILERDSKESRNEYLKIADPTLYAAEKLFVKTNDELDFYTSTELINMIDGLLKAEGLRIPKNSRDNHHRAIREVGGEKERDYINRQRMNGYSLIKPRDATTDPKLNRLDSETKISIENGKIIYNELSRDEEKLFDLLSKYKGYTVDTIIMEAGGEFGISRKDIMEILINWKKDGILQVDNSQYLENE